MPTEPLKIMGIIVLLILLLIGIGIATGAFDRLSILQDVNFVDNLIQTVLGGG